MRTVRQFFAASLLALTLAISMQAGVMSTPVAPPQPTPTPAEANGEMSTPVNGNIHTGAPGDMHTGEATADVALAGAVVGLVQGVLALL